MKNPSQPTSLRLGLDVKAALTRAAEDDGRTIAALTDRILRTWLGERGYMDMPPTLRPPVARASKEPDDAS